ncbi:MAG: transglutaminase-like cysteine peptidase, partial [Thermohalobaculum sp.]|nr:transglutaminase-like cysteine peptidase [Thermohalobaculum sp.]
RNPEARAMPAVLDAEDWRRVRALNLALNQRIRPRDDIDIYGVSDHWADGRADGIGDCEDYIIAKKLALLATGRWRADQLLYAVVRSWRRGYHAVLILRTDRGDFVLDNLRDSILSWEDSDYDFVIRQSAAEPMRWVTVTGAAAPVVAGAPDGGPMQVAAVGR